MDKVVILGGGLSGLITAHCLQRHGIDFQLFEMAGRDEYKNFALQWSSDYNECLIQLDLQHLSQQATTAQYHLTKDQHNHLLAQQASPQYLASESIYQSLLRNINPDSLQFNFRYHKIESHRGEKVIHFDNGESINSKHIICCDGLRSIARRQLLPKCQPFYSGYSSWQHLIELNCEQDYSEEFWGKNGWFIYQPVAENLCYWQCIIKSPKAYDPIMAKLDNKSLRLHFLSYPDMVTRLLTASTRISWQDVYSLPSCESFYQDNTLFLGEAAHGLLPHSLQQYNQMFADIATLSGELNHQDIHQALINTGAQRAKQLQKVQRHSQTTAKRIHSQSRYQRLIRQTAMRLQVKAQRLA